MASCSLLVAQTPDSLPTWQPTVKSVAVFKNGLGFVYKTGNTRLAGGWAQSEPLPPAVLGTVWLGTIGNTTPLAEVLSYKQKSSSERLPRTISELLAANPGKRVALNYVLGANTQNVEGTIVASPVDQHEIERAVPPAHPVTSSWATIPPVPVNDLLLLETGDGERSRVLALQKSTVVAVEFREPANLRAVVETETDRARFQVAGNPQSAQIGMAYMAEGLLWSPSYRVDLTNDKTAALELEAVLTNDLEDLKEAEVSFVVGYPNFLFANVTTPLSLGQSIEDFLAEITGSQAEQPRNPSIANVVSQAVLYQSESDHRRIPASGLLPGETNEDLYVFRKTGVTLRKGERARYTILTASVPYEHLYRCSLDDSMGVGEQGERSGSRDQAQEPQVWHVLRLKNNTSQPWTTAPAFGVRGMMPVAQDVLNYTPPQATSLLKLTVATDVRAEQSQSETARRVINAGNRAFDEVIVKGTVRITSFKAESITLVTRKSLTGEVIAAPEGKITKAARKLTAVNPSSELEWEFPLAPGTTKELGYEYKLLIVR
ncbi:MAG: hypothetical protein EHM23_26625 [Acidobacteria bacterium]|nr:MAG: hypothetical protein EHM23_26625 [Acidobacteriota bacterium]